MINFFNYIERESPVHRLTGATKLICLLIYSTAGMITFDTRLLLFLAILSFALLRAARLKYKDISFILNFTAIFMVFNNIMIFLFSPRYGTEIYGTQHLLFGMTGRYALTAEQLFYHLNQILKYFSMVPVVLLFVCTTNPSEFAASLNRIHVPYSIAYSVALALRYIPDVQREYHDISLAQQARGIEMSAKENIFKRLKSASAILIPLILSSIDRIEVVSNAMELRGFGKKPSRSWYMARPFERNDFIAGALCAVLLAAAIALNVINGGRFWNPFV